MQQKDTAIHTRHENKEHRSQTKWTQGGQYNEQLTGQYSGQHSKALTKTFLTTSKHVQ